MIVFERIQKLAKNQGIGLAKLALKLGFSENLFYAIAENTRDFSRVDESASVVA